MLINFTKMHGAGNDYVYINCFEQNITNPAELAVRLSDRHKGIGGDGVILIERADINGAHAKMSMFNLDGSEGKMCGNGIRCVAEYLFTHNMVAGNTVNIQTLSGIKTIERMQPGLLKVDMGAPELEPQNIPVIGFDKPLINQLVEINGGGVQITCVSMGNPHCVTFVDELENLNLSVIGPGYEKSPIFPEGVNTEFVKMISSTHIAMRVWERGSGETLACGTGTCASVVAAVKCGFCKLNTDVTVDVLGGALTVNYTGDTVYMTGNAVTVFEGCVEV